MPRKHRRAKKVAVNTTPNAKCRECSLLQHQSGGWFKASPPRCTACGGMLDRLNTRKPKSATPKGVHVRVSSYGNKKFK